MQLFQHISRRTALTFALLFSVFSVALAQKTITGKVTAAPKEEALFMATVQVKGTNIGAMTDMNGKYTIEVPETAKTLVFSYTGFISQEVAIIGTEINASLSEGVELTNITVIGSRNASRTKLETAAAVDVIPISAVANEMGQVDVQQILTYVAPSFQSARQTVSDGTDHVDPASLRGLGPDQVLVLVNGKRRHQTALVNVNGTSNRGTVGTDMNAIPATSIERIEILRDGAAAQYGSDAIAGVINIVLKRSTNKMTGNVSYGSHITKFDKNYGWNKLNPNAQLPTSVSVMDGQTIQAGLNYGVELDGGKGYVNLTGEYTQRAATNRSGLYTGRLYPDVRGNNRDDSIMTARGFTRDKYDMRIGNSAIRGGGIVLNGAYTISKKVEAYAFGTFNYKEGNAAGFYRYPTNAASFPSVYPDGFLPNIDTKILDVSNTFGLRGTLGQGFNYDLSNTNGENHFKFGVSNSINASYGPTSQTSFDCGGLQFRQNTTNLDLNKNFPTVLKGLNVAIGGELRAERFTILAGEDASWKTGTASPTLAAGAQVYGGFFPNNAGENKRLSGGAYTDIELDILKSSTVNWMVGGAARWENYSDFGNQIFNYKGTTALRFFEGLFGVRGTYQTGFRAPSLQQKYFTKTTTKFITDASGNLVPQESGVFANNSVAAEIAGIPNLKQETSTAYSFGLTTRPIKGLEMTVDAYQIDIKDRIVLTGDFAKAEFPVAAQPILTAAGASVASFFTNAVNTRSQGAELVLAYSKTFASVHDVRIAFAGSYIQNIVEKDELGNAVINNKGVFPTLQSRFFTREDIARVEYGNPAQKANLTLNYKWNKKFGLMFRANYFGAVVYNDARYITASAPEANFAANAYDANTKQTLDQSFSPKTTFDMSLNYQLTPALGITVGGTNITDVYPDVQTHSGNVSAGRFVYSRRVQQFGFNGAYYFARLNFNIGVKK